MGYDLTNKQSFEEIKKIWNEKIKGKISTNLIYLLANKIDLQNQIEVQEKEGKEFAEINDIKYIFPIFVKNDVNIQNFFDHLKINIEKIDNFNELYSSQEEFKVALIGDSAVVKHL